MDCPLCGAVEETGAFCHRVRGAGGGEGAVWSNAGGGVGGDTALQRKDTWECGEKHRVVGGDVEKEKKRNGPTNAGTCTSVVWAPTGADRKALPPKNIMSKINYERAWGPVVASKMWGGEGVAIPKMNFDSSAAGWRPKDGRKK